jgi:urease accessory protein
MITTITRNMSTATTIKAPDLGGDRYFLLLQINDPTFPIGAYAHSFGLETYIREGLVRDAESAEACVTQTLKHSFLYSGLLAASLAWDAARQEDRGFLDELEELSFAAKSPRELREASVKLGSRFVKTASPLLPAGTVFESCGERLKRGRCSHAVAYGVFCAAAKIDRGESLAAFLYAQTSAMVTTCVKTIPLRQTEGQRILGGCHGLFRELQERLSTLGREDLFRSCPALDIRSMRHERLYSRLYMS